MFASRRINLRTISVLVLVFLFSAVAYGFAAANTVGTSGAGDGQAAISGYTIGAITYTLDSTNPANLSAVRFTVTPSAGASAATTVYVKLVSSGTTYTSCTTSGGGNWTCDLSGAGVTALLANELRVIAAQ